MREVARVFEAITAALGEDGELLMALDYDGTLTPIVPDPADAWLSREVRSDLRALARFERMHVAIISGRALEDLRMRVGLPELIHAGCHGFEIEGPGVTFRHPAAEARRDALGAVARVLRERVRRIPGAVVEAKGLAIAVYYRNVASEELARLEEELERMVPETSGLRLLGGRKVVEVLPTSAWDKGQCARWLQAQLLTVGGPRLTTAFVGDDLTDEIAFAALDADAITVRVGPGPSAARYRLHGVTEVERLLSALAAEVGGVNVCA